MISSEVIGGDGTLVVDNISISAIPEPSSSILALLGAGLLIFRRRR
ncbi:MAG: PEP-CTERM sorting domain-containing protein [Verrucomicrobiaceae bacterium]|nr:PEP-CTERM sorting domain-containing protein [Verrucomicrobiaceae bacterium]